jgi:acyl-CoA synthetase (AMP-forming)/AMP-acid ligase II
MITFNGAESREARTSDLTTSIERALRLHAAVDDCVVLTRATTGGELVRVAYIALREHVALAELAEHASRLGVASPFEQVHLSALPLGAGGEVDVDRLAGFPVLDAATLAAVERELTDSAGSPCAASVRNSKSTRLPLHLADLLPGELPDDGASAAAPAAAGPPVAAPVRTGSGRLAFADGGPLVFASDAPRTLAAALAAAASRHPSHTLTYIESGRAELVQTYPELLDMARRVAAGVRRLGAGLRDPVLLQLDRVPDFLAAFWGCVLAGCVPVPVSVAPLYDSSNSAAAKLGHAWQLLDRAPVITTPSLVPAIAAFLDDGAAAPRVASIDELRAAAPAAAVAEMSPDDPAVFLLTSGSTGMPKCVMLSQHNVLSMVAAVEERLRFSAADVTLNWMAMDHVAGIVMSHVRDVFIGCRQVHVRTELILEEPTFWLDLLERFRVTFTFAPNFAYRLVNECAPAVAERRWDLSTVRSFLNGGEAVVARTVRRFLALLAPHGLKPTTMVPLWGMSETSSAVTYSARFTPDTTTDADPFVDVGPPIPGCCLRIVDDQDAVVEEGTIGRLQVNGPSVTSGYYKRPDLNPQVFTRDGWFNSGDLAIIRDGFLTITGRAKDDVVINGAKYYSHEIEAVAEEVDGLAASFTAACGVHRRDSDTEELAVFFVPAAAGDDRHVVDLATRVRRQVFSRIGVVPRYLVPVRREDIPKTAIGKLQRAQLKQRFEAGGFDAEVKRVEVGTEHANTVPDWFFRRTWRRRTAAGARPAPVRDLVVFGDGSGLAAALAAAIEAAGARCARVEAGDTVERCGVGRYRAPADAGEYARVLDAISVDGLSITDVIHVGGYGPPGTPLAEAQGAPQAELRDVLLVAQALATRDAGAPLRLIVAATNSQCVAEEDVELVRAAIPPLVKTIAQELPFVEATHVDLEGRHTGDDARLLVGEVASSWCGPEVAFRSGLRYVSGLERLRFEPRATHDLPLVRRGFYVLTGGLGGVGVELASLLLQRFSARLLIVGRTAIEAATGPAADERRAAFERLQTAAASGAGAVRYVAADVSDREAMRAAVDEATGQFDDAPLDGVFHLAGLFHERLLAEESADSMQQAIGPKLAGGLAVDALLEDGRGQLFVSFSSATAFFGRLGAGAYVAANGFQDALTRRQRRRGVRAYCCAWSAWDDTGMIRGYPTEPGRARGYVPMSKEQGLWSLLASLASGEPSLLIGLDGAAPPVRVRVFDECLPLAEVVAVTAGSVGTPGQLTVRDRFGVALSATVEYVPALPLLSTGEVDRAALATARRSTDHRAVVAETDLERLIARTWQEVLKIGEADTTVTFFDLGGTSLLAARAYSRLRAHIGTDLSMTDMFRYPTIRALAAHLSGRENGESGRVADEAARGRDRRERMRLAGRRPVAS